MDWWPWDPDTVCQWLEPPPSPRPGCDPPCVVAECKKWPLPNSNTCQMQSCINRMTTTTTTATTTTATTTTTTPVTDSPPPVPYPTSELAVLGVLFGAALLAALAFLACCLRQTSRLSASRQSLLQHQQSGQEEEEEEESGILRLWRQEEEEEERPPIVRQGLHSGDYMGNYHQAAAAALAIDDDDEGHEDEIAIASFSTVQLSLERLPAAPPSLADVSDELEPESPIYSVPRPVRSRREGVTGE